MIDFCLLGEAIIEEPLFDADNAPLLALPYENNFEHQGLPTTTNNSQEQPPSAALLREKWKEAFTAMIDKTIDSGCSYEVAMKSIAAADQITKSNNPVSGVVAMYRGANKLRRKRGKIGVQPAAVARRVAKSRTSTAQPRGRPKKKVSDEDQQDGPVMKKKKRGHNLKAAVAENRPNGASH